MKNRLENLRFINVRDSDLNFTWARLCAVLLGMAGKIWNAKTTPGHFTLCLQSRFATPQEKLRIFMWKKKKRAKSAKTLILSFSFFLIKIGLKKKNVKLIKLSSSFYFWSCVTRGVRCISGRLPPTEFDVKFDWIRRLRGSEKRWKMNFTSKVTRTSPRWRRNRHRWSSGRQYEIPSHTRIPLDTTCHHVLMVLTHYCKKEKRWMFQLNAQLKPTTREIFKWSQNEKWLLKFDDVVCCVLCVLSSPAAFKYVESYLFSPQLSSNNEWDTDE